MLNSCKVICLIWNNTYGKFIAYNTDYVYALQFSGILFLYAIVKLFILLGMDMPFMFMYMYCY